MNCPDCSTECLRDSVDNGVAILKGPWGCPKCGWSEDERYNLKKIDRPLDGTIDQWGGFTPRFCGKNA